MWKTGILSGARVDFHLSLWYNQQHQETFMVEVSRPLLLSVGRIVEMRRGFSPGIAAGRREKVAYAFSLTAIARLESEND